MNFGVWNEKREERRKRRRKKRKEKKRRVYEDSRVNRLYGSLKTKKHEKKKTKKQRFIILHTPDERNLD